MGPIPSTMTAAVLRRCGRIDDSPLEISRVPVPSPRRGEILIKVAVCAVCRTDLHITEGELPNARLPIIPGHQAVGRVAAVGADSSRFEIGTRVGAAWLGHTCQKCSYCKSGRENLCETSVYTGFHRDGGFAEYMTAEEDFVYQLPRSFDDREAAPLLCAGIIGYRALKRSALPERGLLGIFGFGSSAHLAIQAARARGARVFVASRNEKHRALAIDLGAEWSGADGDSFPEKVDSAIVFAPSGAVVPDALAVLRKGGTAAVAGIHMSDIPALNYEKHLFHEKNLVSVEANTRVDGTEFLLISDHIRIRTEFTGFPLEKVNEALQGLKHGRLNGAGVLTMPKSSMGQ